jgi:peptide/nickel transport system substrate-binding protein
MDSRDYGRQPVILTDMPSLGDGATVEAVMVEAGDRVLATSGSVMTLAPGVSIEDAAGARTTFRGDPISMTRMVVTFTLRSDVRWSDGEPLTAGDSVYAFELAADPATPTDKHIIERTADYRAVGEHQVVWQGVPGFLDRAYDLNVWHPLPRHAWEGLSAAELLTAEVSTRQPLSWGPFALREWVPGHSITLERNPFYFRAPEGLPRVDEVTFRFIPGEQALAQQLLAGSCDLVTHEASAALDLDEVSASPAVQAITTNDGSWELLAFGISPANGYQRPDFFEDVRVRRAIARCIDRKELAAEVFATDDPVMHSYLPPEHPLYGPSVRPSEGLSTWSYDVEAGQLLLAQAGWYDEDGDAIREAHGVPGTAEGAPFQVTYKTTDDPLRLRTATLVQAQLQACGIEVTLQPQPADALFAPGPEGQIFGRRFDLAQFSWQTTAEPLCDIFLSSQIPGPGDWSKPNVAGFIDAAYDDACRRATRTLPGSDDHAVRHAVPQRIFSERLPVLPLFQHQKTTLARASVTGLAPNPSQPSELWNLEQLDVQP